MRTSLLQTLGSLQGKGLPETGVDIAKRFSALLLGQARDGRRAQAAKKVPQNRGSEGGVKERERGRKE